MLVLTRRLDESIMIGDDVEIKVLSLRDNQVKLGVAAPRRVAVHRREVYLAIEEENAHAAAVGDIGGLRELTPH